MAVYDFDRFSRNDAIGEVRVPMSSVDLGRPVLAWRELQAAPREEVSTLGPALATGPAPLPVYCFQMFYLLQSGTLKGAPGRLPPPPSDHTTGVLALTIPLQGKGKRRRVAEGTMCSGDFGDGFLSVF